MPKKRDILHHHKERGKFIRHFIFGAEDGLISTLGFLTGITGAGLNNSVVVVAGVAEVFAAALSMGIGTYLSSKSQTELYKREIEKEKEEIKTIPQLEKKEIEAIYKKKGFKGKELKYIIEKICSNKKVWLKEILSSELGITPKNFENPISSAFVMFFTFLIIATIPLIPYFLFPIQLALIISIVGSVVTLFFVGATKTRLTKKNWFLSGAEMLVLGAIAALVTYIIGEFISSLY